MKVQKFNSYAPQVGDLVFVQRLFYKHVGVYVGVRDGSCRCIVHNDKAGGVIFSTLADFAGGSAVSLYKKADLNCFDADAIARRALSLVGRRYNIAKFNCEHAAIWSQTGRLESPQLQAAAVLAVLVFTFILITRNK